MNQKQAKRLRRMERDITTLYDFHYSTVVRMARIEEQLYRRPKLSGWRRFLQKALHRGGG